MPLQASPTNSNNGSKSWEVCSLKAAVRVISNFGAAVSVEIYTLKISSLVTYTSTPATLFRAKFAVVNAFSDLAVGAGLMSLVVILLR